MYGRGLLLPLLLAVAAGGVESYSLHGEEIDLEDVISGKVSEILQVGDETGDEESKNGELESGSGPGFVERVVEGGGHTYEDEVRGRDGVDVVVQVIKKIEEEARLEQNEVDNGGGRAAGSTVDQPEVAGSAPQVEVDNLFDRCEDYTEQFGYECVPYYQCFNGTIITNGKGLIDVRNGFLPGGRTGLSADDKKCPGFLNVCCRNPNHVPPPPPRQVYTPRCGRRNRDGLGVRIQGFHESEAQFGEWPHMCAVLVREAVGATGRTLNVYKCGGSLIAPGVILTAAHCVQEFAETAAAAAADLWVRCGEWDTQNRSEPLPHQDRQVVGVKVHPEFYQAALFNDYALLFVEAPFDLDSHVDTVCLPRPGQTFVGETCFATGWGKNRFGAAGQFQVVLKEIDLPVVDSGTCEASLQNTRLGKRFRLHESFLCAGGQPGKDTCKGDGGGPLVCPHHFDPHTYVQAGIVAWGIGCGETFGVYADVGRGACWIDAAMSCHFGTGYSYFGYSHEDCGVWLEDRLTRLQASMAADPRRSAEYLRQLEAYTECSVQWKTAAELERGEEEEPRHNDAVAPLVVRDPRTYEAVDGADFVAGGYDENVEEQPAKLEVEPLSEEASR